MPLPTANIPFPPKPKTPYLLEKLAESWVLTLAYPASPVLLEMLKDPCFGVRDREGSLIYFIAVNPNYDEQAVMDWFRAALDELLKEESERNQ